MSHGRHILIVDDEEMNRSLLTMLLNRIGYPSETASNGQEALAKITPETAIVVTDVNMPGMNGFDLITAIRNTASFESLPILVVTTFTSREDRLRAVEAGANDFLEKPIDKTELSVRIRSLMRISEAQERIFKYQTELEDEVRRRTQDLHRALEIMAEAERKASNGHLDTVRRLAIAAEFRDVNTAAHILRVGQNCARLAEHLGLAEQEIRMIKSAAAMHDVGKIGTPDSILLKPGKLTDEERRIMQRHTIIGARILGNSSSDLLKAGEQIAMTHHERWDGGGYPNGLSGEEIPLFGRICAIADVFDALISARPYKESISFVRAKEIMAAERGRHFDPELLDLFLDRFEGFMISQIEYPDDRQDLLIAGAA